MHVLIGKHYQLRQLHGKFREMMALDKALGCTPTLRGWLGRLSLGDTATHHTRRSKHLPQQISSTAFEFVFFGPVRPVRKAEHVMLLNCFRLFDIDRNGSLDFLELASGLSKCCLGSESERLACKTASRVVELFYS